jgi:osmotically-inducible protein OsmY
VGGPLLALTLVLFLVGPSRASEPRAADGELRARIEARLSALESGEGADIRVAVREGRVILQGRVALLEQSLRAEQSAWKTDGVIDVDNELRVVPAAPGADAEIERQVRLIIKSDGGFLDTNLELEVVAGVVRLRGLFQDPTHVLDVKHRIASIAGVLEVQIDAFLVALHGGPDDVAWRHLRATRNRLGGLGG